MTKKKKLLIIFLTIGLAVVVAVGVTLAIVLTKPKKTEIEKWLALVDKQENWEEAQATNDKYFDCSIVEGGWEIKKCTAPLETVVIPSTYKGKDANGTTYIGDVVSIATNAFYENKIVKTVVIPPTVESIGMCGLGSLTMEKILVAAENEYFSSENGILYNETKSVLLQYPCQKAGKKVNVRETVKTIGPYAFYWCDKLTLYNIPSSVEMIMDGAFSISGTDAVFNIAEGVKYLGAECFAIRTAQTEIKLPNSINYIGTALFSRCTSLKTVNIPSGVNEIPSGMFEFCRSLSSITIPNTIEKIGFAAFQESGLTSLRFPSSIQVVRRDVIRACSNCNTFYVEIGLKAVSEIDGWMEDNLFGKSWLNIVSKSDSENLTDLKNGIEDIMTVYESYYEDIEDETLTARRKAFVSRTKTQKLKIITKTALSEPDKAELKTWLLSYGYTESNITFATNS